MSAKVKIRYNRLGPITKEWLLGLVRNNPQSGCWEWMRATGRWGYAVLTTPEGSGHASRFYYKTFVGEIPTGLCVLHKCDNVKCVNPSHLFLGTNLENTWDAIRKGRIISKLSSDDVEFIKSSTGSQYILAEQFGVNQSTICRIRSGKRRNHKLSQRKELYANR